MYGLLLALLLGWTSEVVRAFGPKHFPVGPFGHPGPKFFGPFPGHHPPFPQPGPVFHPPMKKFIPHPVVFKPVHPPLIKPKYFKANKYHARPPLPIHTQKKRIIILRKGFKPNIAKRLPPKFQKPRKHFKYGYGFRDLDNGFRYDLNRNNGANDFNNMGSRRTPYVSDWRQWYGSPGSPWGGDGRFGDGPFDARGSASGIFDGISGQSFGGRRGDFNGNNDFNFRNRNDFNFRNRNNFDFGNRNNNNNNGIDNGGFSDFGSASFEQRPDWRGSSGRRFRDNNNNGGFNSKNSNNNGAFNDFGPSSFDFNQDWRGPQSDRFRENNNNNGGFNDFGSRSFERRPDRRGPRGGRFNENNNNNNGFNSNGPFDNGQNFQDSFNGAQGNFDQGGFGNFGKPRMQEVMNNDAGRRRPPLETRPNANNGDSLLGRTLDLTQINERNNGLGVDLNNNIDVVPLDSNTDFNSVPNSPVDTAASVKGPADFTNDVPLVGSSSNWNFVSRLGGSTIDLSGQPGRLSQDPGLQGFQSFSGPDTVAIDTAIDANSGNIVDVPPSLEPVGADSMTDGFSVTNSNTDLNVATLPADRLPTPSFATNTVNSVQIEPLGPLPDRLPKPSFAADRLPTPSFAADRLPTPSFATDTAKGFQIEPLGPVDPVDMHTADKVLVSAEPLPSDPAVSHDVHGSSVPSPADHHPAADLHGVGHVAQVDVVAATDGSHTVLDLGANSDLLAGAGLGDIGSVDVLTLDNQHYASLEKALQSGQPITADVLDRIISGGSGSGHSIAQDIVGAPGTQVIILDGAHVDSIPVSPVSGDTVAEGHPQQHAAVTVDGKSPLKNPRIPDIPVAQSVLVDPHPVHDPVGTVGESVGSIPASGSSEIVGIFSLTPGSKDFPNVPASVSSIPSSISKIMRSHGGHAAH